MNTSGLIQFVPFLVLAVVLIWPLARIMRKMGRSGVWALVWLVPPFNLGLLVFLAWSEWPIEAEVKRLRESAAMLQGVGARGE